MSRYYYYCEVMKSSEELPSTSDLSGRHSRPALQQISPLEIVGPHSAIPRIGVHNTIREARNHTYLQ